MITLRLTEWEVMVLRTALDKHARSRQSNKKHKDAALEIIRKSREQDNPMAALSKGLRGDE